MHSIQASTGGTAQDIFIILYKACKNIAIKIALKLRHFLQDVFKNRNNLV